MTEPWKHHYVSTACEHAVGEGRPNLHAACRRSCKFGEDGVESCGCGCHTGTPLEEMPPPWVDQARAFAERLLTALGGPAGLAEADPGLYREYRSDPHLFWLRGEVQPPGQWRPPASESDSGGPDGDA